MKTDVFKLRKIAFAVLESKMGNREISRTYGVSSSTVTRYTREIKATGLSWNELDSLSDESFLSAIKPKATIRYVQPNFEQIYNFKLSNAYNVKKDLPFHKNGIMHLLEGSCRFHQKDQICDAA